MQIKELKIYTSRLEDQTEFYSGILGLNIINRTEESTSLEVGRSTLVFAFRPETTPYHFAINIPANKELEALEWLKARVEILMDGDSEIQDFDFWNAKAIYFYDRDKNIVELIARKNLDNKSLQKFDSDQFLEISEIGLPTVDIEREFIQLNSLTGIKVFDGGFERFCAIGDENGLVICINRDVKDWFPTSDKAYSSEFEMALVERGKEYRIEYRGEEIRALANKV